MKILFWFYRYNNNGKRIHSETNSLTYGVSYSIYFQDDYGDSIISVRIERQTNPDYERNFKTIYKFIWVNDTILTRNRYEYDHDVLVSSKDLGTLNSKEESRKLDSAKARWFLATFTVPYNILKEEMHSCSDPHALEAQKNVMVKDSLGRVIENEFFFVTRVGEKSGSFPRKKFVMAYVGSSNIIKSCKAYNTFDYNYFIEIVKNDKQNLWQYNWPKNKIHTNIYYEFDASDFLFGIPQLVISSGKDHKNARMYRAIIKTRQ